MRIGSLLLFQALIFFVSASYAFSETYTYTDENGAMAFVDDPGKIPAKARKTMRSLDESPGESSVVESDSSNASNKVIEFYVQPHCGGICPIAEEYFQSRDYRYVKYMATYDYPENYERYKKHGGKGIPFIVIGSYKSDGFGTGTMGEIDKIMGHKTTYKEEEQMNKAIRKMDKEEHQRAWLTGKSVSQWGGPPKD